jgi:hypothetical protein
MNNKNSVEDAIDKARTNTDIGPLNRLLGAMILKRRQVTRPELDEIRRRVYVSVAAMLDKGQPTLNIAKQLGKVVRAEIVNEYRFTRKSRSEVSYEDFDEKTPADGDSFEDVIVEQETLSEIKTALAQMAESDSQTDRKYHAAIIAKVNGKSVSEAVRRFEPAITPNAAAQTLRRAWGRLKAVYEAPKGKKVS